MSVPQKEKVDNERMNHDKCALERFKLALSLSLSTHSFWEHSNLSQPYSLVSI